ncbi:MAG: hypothetical protein R3A78_05470 [Polyangiales bacterium]|nr:hypothetical protein [Myxococcales bacterium]
MRILAGTGVDAPPGRTYTAALSFAEAMFSDSLPRPAKLGRWRTAVGDAFEYALVAPTTTLYAPNGELRSAADAADGIRWISAAAGALRARLVVLETGGTPTTGQRDRDRFRALIDGIRAGGDTQIVWHPAGLWEPEAASAFAASIGIVRAVDPLSESIDEDGPIVYARLRAVGGRRRFSDDMLESVADAFAERAPEAGYVAIHAGQSFRNASTLAALLAERGDAAP